VMSKRRNTATYGRKPGRKPERTKLAPIRNQAPATRRNARCPCGSGQKFKRCCGRPEPPPPPVVNPYKTLASQYTDEQKAAVVAFVKQWGFTPNPSQLMAFMEGDPDELKTTVLQGMANIKAEPKFIYAVDKLGRLVTPKNQCLITPEEVEEWDATVAEYQEASDANERTEGVAGVLAGSVPEEGAGSPG